MMVVGGAPIAVHGMDSNLSDLDCLLHSFGSPMVVSNRELHTLPVYCVVLLRYMVHNGQGVHFR